MRNLLLLFRKYGTILLFLVLEIIAFFLIVNFNNKQKEIFLYSSNLFSGYVLDRYDSGVNYLNLSTLNDSIASENARLLAKIYNQEKPEIFQSLPKDSVFEKYVFHPARIINKSINLRNNRFTLNKGLNDGIEAGMGVLSPKGVVGVVHKTNKRYCSVMPLVNTQFQLSVKIQNKNYFGDLIWQPYDARYMLLKHIPKHASLTVGDTVLTSGYSTIFPADIPVGTIDEIALPAGSNYFDINVKLFAEIARLEYVYIIENKLKELQEEMESID